MRGVPNRRDNRGFASDHGLQSIFHIGARLPLLSQPQAFIKLLPAVIKTQAFQLGFRPMACTVSDSHSQVWQMLGQGPGNLDLVRSCVRSKHLLSKTRHN